MKRTDLLTIAMAMATLLPLATQAHGIGFDSAPAIAKPSMCVKTDQIVFSCALDGGKKVVSICASGDVANDKGRFYYAYGHDVAHPELTYPANNTTPADFTRTHLSFAGNTGGYAYAFGRPGFKYVVYAISGSNEMTNDGLLVLKSDESKPVKHARCDAGTITDTDDSMLLHATLKWKIDPTIDAHGLPDVGK